MRLRVREGERAAFAELYDRDARAVYSHALRLTGDVTSAEDVMSETFLTAWRTRDRVEADGGPLRPWLLGIATNKVRHHRRGAARRWAFLTSRPSPREVEDFAEVSAGRVDDRRELAAVREVLGRLRPHEQEVLALCVWSGLDYAQAAQALGVPVGTVRSRLSRARARLRTLADRRLAEHAPAGPDPEAGPEPKVGRGWNGREPHVVRGEVRGRAAFVALPGEEGNR
ncbi:RNA polymerase sigma factor [Streptomyces sp. XM4193]|uniref:RNA polymerase sigma factor n=1 Tax=Streptomyces sp. XM4193 TaxID=2929782 RepID=UPI001FFB55EB|nr:RNA polymerase sigma factor [Streptomyces sp. XM4193]MCK1797044.1 RNA polymerase sigma factor [Streptomyces sp. XM4193]